MTKDSVLSKYLTKSRPIISSRKQNEEAIKRHIQKTVRPIFLQEIFSKEFNTRSVEFKKIYRLRPNNYSIKMPLLTPITHPLLPMEYKEKKMRGWTGYIIKNYHGCTVEINPKQVIFYYTEKIERIVPYPHTKEIVGRIKKSIEDKLLDTAKRFQKETRIRLDIKSWEKHRKEIEIKGDGYIDSIPKDMNIHAEKFKKVYKKGVEFFDEVSVVNYINNRALEDLSPSLVEELINLRKLICSSQATLNSITQTQLMMVQNNKMIAQILKRLEEDSREK